MSFFSVMNFGGISLDGECGPGGTRFVIPEGREQLAVSEMMRLLDEGCEITLHNDLDEGGEGYTSFRRDAHGYATLDAGHGWQGKWTVTDEPGVRATMLQFSAFNRGTHWSHRGTIR